MAITFVGITESEDNPTNTGNFSFTVSMGSAPKAIAVGIVQSTGTDDQVSAVSIGGVSISRFDFLSNTTSEPGAVYGYFRGDSLPTGDQTLSVTVSGSSVKHVFVMVWTADGNCEIHDFGNAIFDPSATPAVSVDIADGKTAACAGWWHGGPNNSTTGVGTGYTHLARGDFGGQTTNCIRRTNNVSGPTTESINWGTFSNEQYAVMGLAIVEVASNDRSGSGNFQVPMLVMSGSGIAEIPDILGSGNFAVPMLVMAGAGSVESVDRIASGAFVTPMLVMAGAGIAEIPDILGSGNFAVPMLVMAGAGSVEIPDILGSGNFAVPLLVMSGSGTFNDGSSPAENDGSSPAEEVFDTRPLCVFLPVPALNGGNDFDYKRRTYLPMPPVQDGES